MIGEQELSKDATALHMHHVGDVPHEAENPFSSNLIAPDQGAIDYFVKLFSQSTSFLRFSSSTTEHLASHVNENDSGEWFKSFVICNSVQNSDVEDSQKIATTVSLLSWLLSIYRREPNICVVLENRPAGVGLKNARRIPLIRAIDQNLSLLEDERQWHTLISDAQDTGVVSLSQVKSALHADNYDYTDRLEQIYIQWNESDPATHDFDQLSAAHEISYPLQIFVASLEQNQKILVRYDSSLIPKELVEGIFEKYQMFAHDLDNYRTQLMSEIEVLCTTDQYLLNTWNQTHKNYDLSSPYIDYIANWAVSTPTAIAIEHGDEQITFQELQRRSDALASKLCERGVVRGDRVGQYIGRSAHMIVGMLAINKIGGIFVPLDPKSPLSRVTYIVQDSQIQTLLTSRDHYSKIESLVDEDIFPRSGILFFEDGINDSEEYAFDQTLVSDTSTTAYLIYTSGSTGQPKGVQVTHRSLINHNFACQEIYQLGPSDRVLQMASIGFDHSLEEILPILVSGGRVVLYPDRKGLSVENLNTVLQAHKITVFMPTTALWKVWAAASVRAQDFPFPHLRVCAIGGEKCSKELMERWLELCGDRIQLEAGYGVTEAAITSTMWRPQANTLNEDLQYEVPIGKPMGNTRLYVVDKNLRQLPIGAEGELCIGGEGVALGYWKKSDESRKRFIPELNGHDEKLMYNTGDIVRFTANGNLIYVARDDQQLKLGGYRIELAEVEAAINRISYVEDTVVVANERNGQIFLTAFVSTQDDVVVRKTDLQNNLPTYAIPREVVPVSRFPLNSSAKIDRQLLSRQASDRLAQISPNAVSSTLENSHENDRAQVSALVKNTWCQVLHINEVQAKEDFFQAGGSSLLAVLMLDQLSQEHPGKIDFIEFFRNPTVNALVDALIDRSNTRELPLSLV